ncbi:uncharacterized protein [Triticum aestivum]|uniref:uncharacterized protein n=1 Tax=Triticum aestivum TaxID=4565 RepID=UPI001D02EF88|nr:uncharacterized protein LOC123045350 [Triticum aestivum]
MKKGNSKYFMLGKASKISWSSKFLNTIISTVQRKEVKIQEWENCQKSKFKAKLRHAEVQVKARMKNILTKRMSTLSHKVEGKHARVEVKHARVEVKRNRRAVRLARQVKCIRKTGRVSHVSPVQPKYLFIHILTYICILVETCICTCTLTSYMKYELEVTKNQI